MLTRLFPARLDNDYRGYRLALWLFVPIACMKFGIGVLHIASADGGAQSIATMPLDSYSAGAAQNIIGVFARMGLEQLLLGILSIVVLLRYRAMLPLMYAISVTHDLAIEAIARFKPLSLAGTSGARAPALVLLVLSMAGLILSLTGRGYRAARQPGGR
jgi:hypothetical protein